jgi:hypothetical protein
MFCNCGYGDGINHPLGEGDCCRKIVPMELLPSNFRVTKPSDEYSDSYACCDVRGTTITEYTLRYQRGYALHPNGKWSMPKSGDSTNSLECD